MKTNKKTVGGCRWCLAVSAAVAVALAQSSKVTAQDPGEVAYAVMPIAPEFLDPVKSEDATDKVARQKYLDDSKRARDARTTYQKGASDVLSGAGNLSSDAVKTAVKHWFNDYIFAQMTQTDATSLGDLPKNRQSFFNSYVQRASSPAAHDFLIKDVTVPTMTNMVRGNYHPGVRYNAMLIIGELNNTEAVTTGSAKSAPEPLPAALPFLLTEFKNPAQIEAVRVAALLGILRHAEMEGQRPKGVWTPEVKKDVTDTMMALIKPAAAEEQTPGQLWIRRRAIDVLAALRDPGPGNAFATALEEFISDSKEPMSLRCTAAVAYGRLMFPKTYDPAESTRKLANLADEAVRLELVRLDDEVKKTIERLKTGGGTAGGYGMSSGSEGYDTGSYTPPYGGSSAGGYSGGLPGGVLGGVGGTTAVVKPRIIEKYQIETARRRLKYQLYCVQQGVAGSDGRSGLLIYASQSAYKKFVDDVKKALDGLMESTDEGVKLDTTTAETLALAMQPKLDLLKQVVKTGPKPKAAEVLPSGLPGGGLPGGGLPGGGLPGGGPPGVGLPGGGVPGAAVSAP